MRVLIPNHFPLQGSGSGIYVLNVAQELVQAGHEVLVIIPENMPVARDEYPFDLDIIPFKGGELDSTAELDFNFPCFTTHPRSTQTFYDLSDEQELAYEEAWRRHLVRAVGEFEPDVIHAHHVWVAPYITSSFEIPTVITIHGTDLMGFRDGPRYRHKALAAAEHADALIAISRQVSADAEVAYGVPPEKIHLIWNGFDSRIFKVIPEASKASVFEKYDVKAVGDAPLVSFVGKFTDFKGIDVLLKAAALYEPELPGVQTLLVGDGGLWNDMHMLRQELGLKGVTFAGHQSQKEVANIY
ncbi:MAG: glycosyltransferase, partial [Candidatus Promineifilaceae bacterium]